MGFDAIAIADHNTAENLPVAYSIAKKEGILLIPAMEITTVEEAHILALFESLECAMEMQSFVYRSLPKEVEASYDPVYQLVVNEQEEILEFNNKPLFSATNLSVSQITHKIHECGGIAVASHIDREYFSLISQLGFIPEEASIDALEISYNISQSVARQRFPDYTNLAWIRNSDAHTLNDIGIAYTMYKVENLSYHSIAEALRHRDRLILRRE